MAKTDSATTRNHLSMISHTPRPRRADASVFDVKKDFILPLLNILPRQPAASATLAA